jgi:hypothetical protein
VRRRGAFAAGVAADLLVLLGILARRRALTFGPLRRCCPTFEDERHARRCPARGRGFL